MNTNFSEKPLAHENDELGRVHTTCQSRFYWRYKYVALGFISAVLVLYLLFPTIMAGNIFTTLCSSEDYPESVLQLEPPEPVLSLDTIWSFSGYSDNVCKRETGQEGQSTALRCTNAPKSLRYLNFKNGGSRWILCLYEQAGCAGDVTRVSGSTSKCSKSPITGLSFKVANYGGC